MVSSATQSSVSSLPAAEVRAELEKVIASAGLQRSPQLQRLLRFITEETLGGRGDRLKEYVLGTEIFGRPATYDPRIDSLVRVEAHRLRVAIEEYYREAGRNDPVVIALHKGSYVPTFRPSAGASAPTSATADAQFAHRRSSQKLRLGRIGLAVLILGALLVSVIAFSMRSRRVHALTERDSIVLAEFVNNSGEPIFDEALKQGLSMELEQSPFLNIVSDRRTAQTLKLMGRSPTEHLNPDLAREVCQRTGSKAMVTGSIARLGTQYVIALTATDCSTGDAFAHQQAQATTRETVLKSLGLAASKLRVKLGESLNSIRRFDAPIEEATTSSLEALQAYTLGRKTAREKGSPADIPFYRRAIELDPNFAVAYAALGVSYFNLGQPSVASDYLKKAYNLRERVTERERYRIAAYYLQIVTGDLEQSRQTYELWKQSYPRDFAPYINLGLAYTWMGDYEKSVVETSAALRLEPTNVLPYSNLAAHNIKLGRFDAAKAILDEALARSLTSKFLRSNLCYLAFLRNDTATMEQQLAEVRGSPGDEDPLLSQQSDNEAYYGRLKSAREFSRQAVESAGRAGAKEAAAGWLVNAALREAEYGNPAAALREVREAMGLAPGRDVRALAALAVARAGDLAQAESLLQDLQRSFPANTMIRVYWAPAIGAAIEIGKRNPMRALDLLQTAGPYELGSPPPIGLATLYPVYLRGEAYLLGHSPDAAEKEFQKILDHQGLVLNFPLNALAHLQLARARNLGGDVAGARQAYGDFVSMWKDADPDVPILRQAKAEYAQLR